MVIPPPLPQLRVVLRGIQHRLPHELAILQHPAPLLTGVVVPVHHQRLVGGIHLIVIQEPAHGNPTAAQLPLQLGILLLQHLVTYQLRGEEVGRVLNVRHPRLPEQVQQIHPPDGHVPQTVELSRIPEHAIYGAPAFQLVPPCAGIRPLELILLQDGRQNTGQLGRLRPVPRFSGQHRRLRVAVHGVCVLGEDAVHQPTAGGLRVAGIAALPLLLHLRPVPQLPELLIVDDAPLQIYLPLPVLFQKLRRPAHLLLSDAGLLPRRLLRLAHGISPLPFVQNSFPVLTSPPTAAGSFPSCCTFPCNTGNFSRFHRLTSIFSGSSCTGSAVSTRRGGIGRAMHRYRLSSAT